jgi:PBSX family phage terminase large subunit
LIITGGRASAKSYHTAISVLNLTYEPNHVILYTRYTLTSAFDSIIPEFIEKIEIMGKESDFDITKTDITNKRTGSKILFRGIKTSSGKQTAKLKSLYGVTTWILEEGEDLDDESDFEKIDDSIRTKVHPNRVIIIMNPSFKTHYFYRTFISTKRSDVTHIHTDYKINKHNLSDSILAKIERMKETNFHRYEHVYLGKWLEDREGLLWNQAIIERSRVRATPVLVRVVIAIDPATTANKNSDETGIIAFGIDEKRNGYVLEDGSGTYSPEGWANEAKRLKEKWKASCYVAEKNQGGDMVETILRQFDDSTRIKLVHATKGKYTRAEPIFSLYEQNRIFHVGNFNKLEKQMITFNPEASKESPDRVDALVWGATDCMLDEAYFSDWDSIKTEVERVF